MQQTKNIKMLEFATFPDFDSTVKEINQRDLFSFMNSVVQNFTLNNISGKIMPNKFEYTDGDTNLMTRFEIHFDLFQDVFKTSYVFEIHRAKDFSCSNSGIKKIN